MVSFSRNSASLLFLALLTLSSAPASSQLPDFDVQKTLPITLDADSSEFDRKSDRLTFRGLHITQGDVGIKADEAEATRLDFENSQWTFFGNVEIDSAGTKAYCDRAEISFKNHQITNAILLGEPARFEQSIPEEDKLTRGHANQLEYDLVGSTIKMVENAWLSDGSNEVSGARINYDLANEFITADADANGPVRMKITPPAQSRPGTAN